jgi:AraC-like DNA-binding protein
VTSIESDPTLIRVEQLAELHRVSVRTLQRLMRHHVGLGPKQLIRRYRLLEAASQLASGNPCNHAHLALALGYADQSHFTRDFRAVIGTSPGRQSKQAGSKVPYPARVSSR